MRIIKISAVFLLMVTMACNSSTGSKNSSGEAIALKFNLKEGETYRFSQEIEQNISQSMMGQTQDITNTVGGVYAYHVNSVENEVSDIDVTFESMTFKMAMNGEEFLINSDDTESTEPTAKIFQKMAGKSINVKMNPTGEISEVKGFSKMFTDIFSEIELPSEVSPEELEEGVSGMFDEGSFKTNMSVLTAFYPNKPVKVGETWTTKMATSKPMNLTYVTTWELIEEDGKIAKIKGSGTIEGIQGEDAWEERDGMKMRYKLKGNQDVEATIHLETGWFETMKTYAKFKGDVEVVSTVDEEQGMEIPMELEMIGTYTGK